MAEIKPMIGLKWEPKLPNFISSITKTTSSNKPVDNLPQNTIWKPQSELVDGLFVPPANPRKLNKLARKNLKDTAGKKWFDMPATTITPEIKKDLQMLKLRAVLDPKRHYKKGDRKSKEEPKHFQVGEVVVSPADHYSSNLTRKEKRRTLTEEILADVTLVRYRKRKVREIEEEKRNVGGRDKWKNKGKSTWKGAKHRRQG